MWETRWQGLGKGFSQKDCPVWKVRQSLVPPLREEPSSRSACYGRRPPAGSAAGRCALQGHRQPKGPSSNFPSHRAPSRARDRSRGWPGHRTAGTGSARHWGRGKKRAWEERREEQRGWQGDFKEFCAGRGLAIFLLSDPKSPHVPAG